LYTNASGQGTGGFYYLGGSRLWKENISAITKAQAYTTAIAASGLSTLFDINKFEVQAIQLAMEQWGTL
jgi:hypothetical protein